MRPVALHILFLGLLTLPFLWIYWTSQDIDPRATVVVTLLYMLYGGLWLLYTLTTSIFFYFSSRQHLSVVYIHVANIVVMVSAIAIVIYASLYFLFNAF
jgi:membrane protein YdbS with pleckstrin-like domain